MSSFMVEQMGTDMQYFARGPYASGTEEMLSRTYAQIWKKI